MLGEPVKGHRRWERPDPSEPGVGGQPERDFRVRRSRDVAAQRRIDALRQQQVADQRVVLRQRHDGRLVKRLALGPGDIHGGDRELVAVLRLERRQHLLEHDVAVGAGGRVEQNRPRDRGVSVGGPHHKECEQEGQQPDEQAGAAMMGARHVGVPGTAVLSGNAPRLIVAEAARNVVCVGARPIAITNCLNFASPERTEVMWSFSEVIDGMAEACRAFETPVVSGNVSFYNETEGRGILPTPVIGMVGLIEDVRRVVSPGFKKRGDVIALLGTTHDDLAMSEFAVSVAGVTTVEIVTAGKVPELDMDRERAVQKACLEAAEAGLLLSAHDCADGGLAVTLAESCFSTLGREAIGADVDIEGALGPTALLFSESPSRIVISFAATDQQAIEEIAARNQAPFAILGHVGGTRLTMSVNRQPAVSIDVVELEEAWRSALAGKLQAELVSV